MDRQINDMERFNLEIKHNISNLAEDNELHDLSNTWMREAARHKYVYNFSWLGIPIIQLPQDIIAMQEIIWEVKPELIIETGIARGGSLIFYASMLELISRNGSVLGIDIDIRSHNREAIEKHPISKRIQMIEGSSINVGIIEQVYNIAQEKSPVLVVLDSSHTHEHVIQELRAYSNLVTCGSYLVVFDTAIEDMPSNLFSDRPWGKGNNPKTAVNEFLKSNDRFEVDHNIQDKLLITVAPDGYLKCIKD